MHVVLDDLHFTNAYDAEYGTEVSKPTGNILNFFKFSIRVQGIAKKDQLEEVLNKNSFTFKVPDAAEPLEFKAKKTNFIWSYTETPLTDDTVITANIEIAELDKDLPENHNVLVEVGSTAVANWLRTRAISSLLIKKGIITQEEYEQELKEVWDRDAENLNKLIAYGIPEPKKDE